MFASGETTKVDATEKGVQYLAIFFHLVYEANIILYTAALG